MPVATPSESAERALRVAVLADSDTRWKWGALTAQRLAETTGDAVVDGMLLRGRATPTARQLADTGVRGADVREVTTAEFLAEAGAEDAYDVVVLACVGGAVQAMLHGLAHQWQGRRRRPVVVTGYVGVVYEKLTDGLLLRNGADIVLANSAYDADRFRAVYAGVGTRTGSIVECALPFLGGAPYAPSDKRPHTVTFAVQPSVPSTRKDRLHLLQRAVGHARLHPEREVLIKLRSRPGEHTTHIEELPYQRLAERLPGGLPDNCRLVYGHMGEVLDRTDVLVTVSSTAALESLHRGIPTGILTDLGVREALGNHHFVGSGCLISWDRLDAGELPTPDPEWTARQGVASDGGYEAAFDAARKRLAELLAEELPPLNPYYTSVTAGGYLPGLLNRYGLTPDGTPNATAGGTSTGLGGAARRVVRRAARGAYRQGVQRVAPVIRRMGQL
ncbi:DUF6716 putative glycosyltransferase [Streptomyces sp. WMMC897]|uniref:DUF6716 putative glycosyltransferase n=1 Tax=Streptomyces sp. WMMC897 TaxID=3014782 RepID=UPI0022B6F984|nr:DUF6716 putative glycosyltransferase [Streptomyces sp. WMMC897]MCZ7416976.1 hypothetical protein [Streptomyces sp. WMMC897]